MSLTLNVSFRGTTHTLNLEEQSTLSELQDQLEALTSVPPSLQKLLYKGKNSRNFSDDTFLKDAGFKHNMKVQLMGTTHDELGGMQKTEEEQNKRNRILAERALKPAAKLRSTGSSSTTSITYRFHKIIPLPHLPEPESALKVLTRLSNDPAIQHVMQKHKFSVGILTELAPHEHPELLGLNVNAGQEIKLRIRTNAYDGFRSYLDIRKVLCHELTHNVHGDHDNDFKELNSRLNREVAQFEQSGKDGTHHLTSGDIYEPESEQTAEAHVHILGGANPSSGIALDDSREERRRRVLEATLNRLRKEEEEIERSCGTH